MHKIKHFLHKALELYKKINLTTPVAIIIAACILGVSHLGYGFVLAKKNNGAATTFFKGKAVTKDDLMIGNTKSDVIVVEYSDTECPFCAQLHPTITQLQQDYASKIGFVYRYFPLTQIHPHSFEEARAVYCVGKTTDAKKRHDYINEMFTYKLSKKNMVLPEGGKEALAKNIGVNESDFNACMSSQESSDVISASIQDGIAAGVEGTPATFVLLKDGDQYNVVALVDGARPYSYFKAVIDDALSR